MRRSFWTRHPKSENFRWSIDSHVEKKNRISWFPAGHRCCCGISTRSCECREFCTEVCSDVQFEPRPPRVIFSAVRASGGWNNNPTSRQFTTAYRQLLMRHNIEGGRGNCRPQDDTDINSVQDQCAINSLPTGILDHGRWKIDNWGGGQYSHIRVHRL